MIGSADLTFESKVWFRQADLSSPLASLPQKEYKLFIASLNYGLGVHPGDDAPTTAAEAKNIFSNWHAATTAEFYTFVVFGEEASLDAVQQVLMESSAKRAGPVCRIYWHKSDKQVLQCVVCMPFKGPHPSDADLSSSCSRCCNVFSDVVFSQAQTGLQMNSDVEVGLVAYFATDGKRREAQFNYDVGDKRSKIFSFPCGQVYKEVVTGATTVSCPWGKEFLRRIFELVTQPGDIIADMFCGHATAAVVAVQMKRHVLAVDINPDAITTSRQRLQSLKDAIDDGEYDEDTQY